MTPRQWAVVVTAAVAAMLEVIDVSICNVALPHIQSNLGATLAEVGWVVTGYAMASVVMIPLSEWLSERFGQRSYFVFCLAGFTGAHRAAPSPLLEDDPSERIKDMDLEGEDVNLMLPSGWFGSFTADNDLVLETGMYRAYHQWMEDYCKPYPDRLGGVILCSARDIPGSVAEIKKWGKSRWAWAIMVYAPADMQIGRAHV